jgi:ubiquitin carboxyl-terminal hydrolase 34
MEFYCSFVDLTAYFVTLDIHVIRETQPQLPPTGGRAPDLLSASYLRQVSMLTRRDSLLKYEPPSVTVDGLFPLYDDVTYLVTTLQNGLGGGLGILEEFVARLVDTLPTYPRLIDNLGHVCEVLLSLSQEALRVIQLGQDNEQQAKASLLENAHALFANISACVELLIGKYVTQLNADGLQNSILALAELLKVCVQGSHKLAAEASWEYQQQHPELPPRYAAEAISLEWRFDILGTLIRCSQMQLRVMAVTTMCNELVAVWKQYNDDFTNPLLKHVSDYLIRTDLIEYIIGPNCHPEIILESANVIGFLAVTKMYQPQHTDRIWHAIITSQDPRVSDALTRMVTTIVGLFSYSSLSDLCGKLQDLPLEDFNPAIRALWETLMHHMPLRAQAERRMLTYQPYELCLRLLRESSICANGSQVANPELQQLSMQKFKELLHHGPDEQGRADLYRSCLQDVSDKSRTALGSLWCLSMTIRSTLAHEMEVLTKEHDMTRLIVEELEHAVETGKSAGVPAVLCDNTNQPRRDFISHIIQFQPATLDDVLGEKLWDILVGSRSPCSEDRAAGWSILNTVVRRSPVQNPFIRECVSRYLPSLPSQCFCEGMLEFVKNEVLTLVSKTEDFQIDDEQSVSSSCLEQLWRIIHTAEDAVLVDRAIRILVVDVYMDSELLSSYPLNRRRQVHSSLVTRCFSRLKEAAKQIKTSAEGTSSSEDDSMVIVATDTQIQEQELSFIRTLQLLRYFLEAYQSKPNLAAPDLRAFMGQPPTQIEGELAQLKYQSFDGSEQTDVKPLNIGTLNSGASLLACIRQETGFHNYRMYYRGQQFLPDERQVCKSLDDLHFSQGLILVKKEEDDANNTVRIKPGSSPLQIKILAHFKEMWEFLSMEEKLAREVSIAIG